MYFPQNVKFLRKRKKRSQDDVAFSLDLGRTSLSAYENGATQPNFETLIRFSDYFSIPIDKLLRVDLTAIKESQLSAIERGYDIDLQGNRLRVLTTTVNEKNEENIELVTLKAKAGYTSGYADPEYIGELPKFHLPFLDKNKKYRTFPVSGDSMPPVSDKSYVTGEYLQDWTSIRNGTPYIIIIKGEKDAVFKIVYNKIQERQSLLLCSTNPEYAPYEVNIADVLEVWKFNNFINMELPEPNLSKDTLITTVLNLQREMSELKNERNIFLKINK